MKAALCLAGQPRFVEEGYRFFKKNLLDNNDIDVFIHCYYDKSLVGENIPYGIQKSNCLWEKDTIEKIMDLYNPKGIIIEKPEDILKEHNIESSPEASPFNMIASMWYSIYMANSLKVKEEMLVKKYHYDCVVRSRFDLELISKIDLNNFSQHGIYTGCGGEPKFMWKDPNEDLSKENLRDFQKNPIIFNSVDFNNKYLIKDVSNFGVNDCIAIGSSNAINYYSTLFSNIVKYCSVGVKVCSECLLAHHIQQLNPSATAKQYSYVLPCISFDLIRLKEWVGREEKTEAVLQEEVAK